MELNINDQKKASVISFNKLNEEEQYNIYDSLIGKRVVIKGSRHKEIIILEGTLESRGLYLGEISYDLKIEEGIHPKGFNLLYNIEEIKVIH